MKIYNIVLDLLFNFPYFGEGYIDDNIVCGNLKEAGNMLDYVKHKYLPNVKYFGTFTDIFSSSCDVIVDDFIYHADVENVLIQYSDSKQLNPTVIFTVPCGGNVIINDESVDSGNLYILLNREHIEVSVEDFDTEVETTIIQQKL